MWRWCGRRFCLGLLVLIIVMFAFKKAFGINDYSYRGYDDDVSRSVGVCYRVDLGSSCTDPDKRK